MDKKRVKIVLTVLNAVRSTFPETQEFINSTLERECEKERMTADEVICYKFKSKKLVWTNIFVLDFVLKCLFFVYRCGKIWQIIKRRKVYQKKR